MIWHEELFKQIQASVAPDCWNPKWRQVNRFGGGMAVELEVGEFLNALTRMTKPEVVVETGTHKGFSTLMIAHALRVNGFGHVHTVDLKDYGVTGELAKFDLSAWATFHVGDSASVIHELVKKIKRIDFLWLDADHATASVLKELEAAMPSVKPGTLIAFHDTKTDPREAAAVLETRKRFPKWECLEFVTARGFVLMKAV